MSEVLAIRRVNKREVQRLNRSKMSLSNLYRSQKDHTGIISPKVCAAEPRMPVISHPMAMPNSTLSSAADKPAVLPELRLSYNETTQERRHNVKLAPIVTQSPKNTRFTSQVDPIQTSLNFNEKFGERADKFKLDSYNREVRER